MTPERPAGLVPQHHLSIISETMTIQQKAKLLYRSVSISGMMVAVLWIIHSLQWMTGIRLATWGVLPRDDDGIWGIAFSPLLHSDWSHLFSNSLPLFVLTAIIFYFYRRVAMPSFLMIYFLTGAAVWLFGRGFTYHIGASGVVYGLVAFVFWSGVFRRNVRSIALALIVAFYYGSMILGILPGQEGISWESHLYGALIGIFVAYWFKEQIEQEEERTPYSWETQEEETPRQFLDPDTFDKPKSQRQRWR